MVLSLQVPLTQVNIASIMASVKILSCLLASILASLCDVHAATPCNSHDFHCYTSTAFQVCVDSGTVEDTPAANACPTGTSCHLTCDLPCADPTATCATAPAPTPPPGKEECNTAGFYCATSTHFKQCLGTATTPQPDLYSCPPNTVCDMYCEYECRSAGVTCSAPGPPPATCTAAGFQAVKGDNRKYVLCTEFATHPGAFRGQEYSCPGGGYFVSGRCTMVEPFVCKEYGKTPDPKSCTSYYFCSFIDEATGWVSSHYNCPSSSKYNPTTKKCDTEYVCPTLTTARLLSRSLLVQFACSAPGRFSDTESAAHYYLCVVLEDGSFVHRRYRCPGSSAFDPNTSKCSTNV